MKTIKSLLAGATALVLLTCGQSANAATTFKFDGVSFTDGGSLTGTFTTGDELDRIINWDLRTSPSQDGSGYVGEAYNPDPGSGALLIDPNFLIFSNSRGQSLYVLLAEALSSSGAEIFGASETSREVRINRETAPFPGAIVRADVTGAVPEPATWAMMIGGIGAAGGALRRRRANVSVRYA